MRKKTNPLRCFFLLCTIILLGLCLGGCVTYSGMWDEFLERLGFERPESGREEIPRTDENLNDRRKQVEEAPRILNELEERVFTQINEYRTSKGLNTLTVDERLVEQARIHSKNMGAGSVPFSHQGFRDRIAGSGISYKSAAENLAYNNHQDPAASAVDGWIASETHRRNIEGNFDLTGVGVVKNEEGVYYFTQLFLLK